MEKKKISRLTVSIISALVATLAAVSPSIAGPGGPPRGAGGPLMYCVEQLNLSTETRAKLESIIQTQREDMTDYRDTMKAAMDTYYTALTDVPQDSAALAQAKQAMVALEQKHAESRFALEKSIVDLLSNDEASQLRDCLSTLPEPPSGPPAFGGKVKSK